MFQISMGQETAVGADGSNLSELQKQQRYIAVSVEY